MRITNATRQVLIADKASIAESTLGRMVGLLGRAGLASGEALVLKPCSSVHTFFMRFTMDAIFVDKNNTVVKTLSRMRPWRMSGVYLRAVCCIELAEGTVEATNTLPGDTLSFS